LFFLGESGNGSINYFLKVFRHLGSKKEVALSYVINCDIVTHGFLQSL
jgi:hypothetical protein